MAEHIRSHERLSPDEAPPVTFTVRGALPRDVPVYRVHGSPGDSADLVVHFHGAGWLVGIAAKRNGRSLAVAAVNLGGGSSAYERPFTPPAVFPALLAALRDSLTAHGPAVAGVRRLYLSAFSAGYGAVRAILRTHPEMVDGILLLDGLHTDYIPDRTVLAEGGALNADKLSGFLDFARWAIAGEKRMVITHSSIFPGTYASTTETTDWLIAELGLKRTPVTAWGPVGMQQVGATVSGRLSILAFAGNSAPDHVDHLHGLPVFLDSLLTRSEDGAP